MSETILNSVVLAAFSAALAFASAWFLAHRAAKTAERTQLLQRVSELESKLALVNQQMIPISTAMVAMFVKELTHYHTPEMDALMVKIGPPNTLTAQDYDRLAVLLEERTRDMGPLITDSERDAAGMLLPMLKRSRIEMETLDGAESLKMRLVPVAAVVGLSVNVGVEDG